MGLGKVSWLFSSFKKMGFFFYDSSSWNLIWIDESLILANFNFNTFRIFLPKHYLFWYLSKISRLLYKQNNFSLKGKFELEYNDYNKSAINSFCFVRHEIYGLNMRVLLFMDSSKLNPCLTNYDKINSNSYFILPNVCGKLYVKYRICICRSNFNVLFSFLVLFMCSPRNPIFNKKKFFNNSIKVLSWHNFFYFDNWNIKRFIYNHRPI